MHTALASLNEGQDRNVEDMPYVYDNIADNYSPP